MTQEEYDKLVETKAEAIYKTWKAKGGWRPWATGGNSLKQEEARQVARKEIGPVKIEQPKPQTMEQRALEAERQVGELREQLEEANNLRLAAEHNLLDVREQLADESADHRTTQVNRDRWQSNYHEAMDKLDTAMGLLRSIDSDWFVGGIRQCEEAAHYEIQAFLNTTSTEGKDHESDQEST